MAIDKAVDSGVLDGNLTSIADACRDKTYATGELAFPADFLEAINGIVLQPHKLELVQDITITDESSIVIDSDSYRELMVLYIQPETGNAANYIQTLWAVSDSNIETVTYNQWILGKAKGMSLSYLGIEGNIISGEYHYMDNYHMSQRSSYFYKWYTPATTRITKLSLTATNSSYTTPQTFTVGLRVQIYGVKG